MKCCSRRELESLIGHLNHACKVVRSGRTFLRRMLDLLQTVPNRPHLSRYIRLNGGFRSDLAWWRTFIAQWNGVSYLPPPAYLPSRELQVTSDASGSWGCGAWHGHSWFQVRWDERSHHLSIAEKELVPIIIACVVWGGSWQGHQVLCHCDNQVIVACLRSRTSKNKGIMHLLRCLLFIEATRDCHLVPMYINTRANDLADDLSRDHLSRRSLKPTHNRPKSPFHSWTCCWTQPTGPRHHGAVSSTLFPGRPSSLNTKDLCRCSEAFPCILYSY